MKPKKTFRIPKIVQIVVIITLVSLVGFCVWYVMIGTNVPAPSARPSPLRTASNLPEDLAHAEKLRQLVQSNGGCTLPCFLGISLGEATWESIQGSLKPFSPSYYYTNARLFDAAHNVDLNITFTLASNRENPAAKVERIRVNLIADSNMAAGSYYALLSRPYLLASVLTQLGEPSQVLVQVMGRYSYELYFLDGALEYALALFYDQLGLIVDYHYDVVEAGKKWKLCPARGTMINLYIATPEKRFSTKEVLFVQPYYPLEQATDMDIDTFYKTFKDADLQACIETPARLWK